MKKSIALTVATPLLVLVGGVSAQVYRCESGGRIAFSDRACPAGARESRNDYATSPASGSLDMQITVKHYTVQGRDEGSLSRSLRANGPRGFHGLAGWSVDLAFTKKPERELCRIASVNVKVVGEILMPHWADEADAPIELQRRWRDQYAGLKRHEDGHLQHGRELALLVKERLLGLGAMPCANLDAVATAEYQRLYNNLKSRDQEYDRRTDHGRF